MGSRFLCVFLLLTARLEPRQSVDPCVCSRTQAATRAMRRAFVLLSGLRHMCCMPHALRPAAARHGSQHQHTPCILTRFSRAHTHKGRAFFSKPTLASHNALSSPAMHGLMPNPLPTSVSRPLRTFPNSPTTLTVSC